MSKLNYNFRRTVTAVAIGAALSLSSAGAYAASNTNGSIAGHVSSSSETPISDATIIITNDATGVSRTVRTGANGNFQMPRLSIGEYTITASKDGYQTDSTESVKVSIGENTSLNLVLASTGETVTVIGSKVSAVDFGSAESALNLSEAQVDRLPLGRNITAVALLAPGTTKGDSAFGNLASFGGSTVGENAYYINGMNLTNFRNGLGGATVPFDMYKEFSVKTGGYSAEYGRSTGGVVSGVTKSGTNDFEWGAEIIHSPESGRETAPDVFRNDGTTFILNSKDVADSTSLNLHASGAIIPNQLFYYVFAAPTVSNQGFATTGGGRWTDRERDNLFFGGKIDYNISENHLLEWTFFSDESDTEFTTFDAENGNPLEETGSGEISIGGTTNIFKYTGYLTDDLTISALAGKVEFSGNTITGNPDIQQVYDDRTGVPNGYNRFLTPQGLATQRIEEDEREAFRLDFDYYVGDHEIRFGYDKEVNTSVNDVSRSGGSALLIFGDFNDSSTWQVEEDVYRSEGNFKTISEAIYIEDTWAVTDEITVRMGLRNEAFDNQNASGQSFIKIDNQLAPRLGLAWDVNGQGDSKIFANYGRYHLPVATNTNIRLAGAEFFERTTYDITGFDSQGLPLWDANAPVGIDSFGNGGIEPDTRSTVNSDIKPMYQDEFILGFQQLLEDGWSYKITGVHRDLKSTLEDVAIDAAVLAWAEQNGRTTVVDQCINGTFDPNFAVFGCDAGSDGVLDTAAMHWGGFHQYVLTNPGEDMTVYLPEFDEYATLSAEDLGYPASERYYNAITLELDRQWDGVWSFNGTYTWAQSYGNNEGYVRSDNNQDDAGLTTLFDQPGLLDGGFGYLPNDRRHAVKLRGAYQMTENFRVSGVFNMTTGRPQNAFGMHPTDLFANLYRSESFYQRGELVPRGTRGRTPTTSSFDLSFAYSLTDYDVEFKLDIFNVFNQTNATETVEIADDESTANRNYFLLPTLFGGTGEDYGLEYIPNAEYGLPTSFQAPRSIRLTASMRF